MPTFYYGNYSNMRILGAKVKPYIHNFAIQFRNHYMIEIG